ncbi:MAG: PilN domain-containing protein [Candidatus Omnitrophica bacterium]|nr:PilN domain-containing protein [Candidatus Omnitrophota bacterium]
MITINLLPFSLRKTERRISLPTNFPYKIYLFGIVAVLLFLHFSLFSLAVIKKVQIMGLEGRWDKMEPQSKESAAIKKEIKDLEAQAGLLSGSFERKASLTEIMSGLNAAVPKGLWLESFSYGDEGLVIQGSVVSLEQNEMTIIGKFLQDLKGNKVFGSVFSKIELSSVQRRTVKTYDVVDFVFTGDLKK